MTVIDLMNVEHKLLEINEKERYTLPLWKLHTLNKYLNEIGEITGLYFAMCSEYNAIATSEEDAISFIERLRNDPVEYDISGVTEFIDSINKI